jgi:transposase
MTDGYAVCDAIVQPDGLVHLGCWAHCRRGFHEVLSKSACGPEQLDAQFLALFAQLYAVDSSAR